MKKAIIAIAIIGFSLTMSITVWAGTWKQDNNGWWYENDNGTYQKNGWFQDPADSQWYYASNSGYILQNTWMGNYYLGASGAMLTNTTTPDGYKVGADGAWIQEYDIDDLYGTYYNEDNRYNSSYYDRVYLYKTYTDHYHDKKTYNNVIRVCHHSLDMVIESYALFSFDGDKITVTRELDEWNNGRYTGYTSGTANSDGSIAFSTDSNRGWLSSHVANGYATYRKE